MSAGSVGAGQDDPFPRTIALPECETSRCKSRGVGRKGPRRSACPPGQSRWEKRLLRFLELSGVGRVVTDGSDEDEAWARRMDSWIVWEAERR
jgi:hypothetical protein